MPGTSPSAGWRGRSLYRAASSTLAARRVARPYVAAIDSPEGVARDVQIVSFAVGSGFGMLAMVRAMKARRTV